MRNLSIYILIIVIFSGCSFDTPPNDWQYKSVNAFDAYTKNFLSGNDRMAKNDLKRAIAHAKQSADLTSLARVYLGECALDISIGIDNKCQKYKSIEDIVDSKPLNAYYNFLISNIQKEEITNLVERYKDFALYLKNKEYKKANNEILNMDRVTSQLLAAALLKEKINKRSISKVIKSASFNGYKKAVLYWLNQLKTKTTNITEIEKIDKKISIMKN